ncbi:hypothetical protein [Bartonella sp. CB169]|uniref:hypothetical protein n=1 Tax=Bartonella sp. CB169 TaxID=3112257 RepID=UPI00300E15A3
MTNALRHFTDLSVLTPLIKYAVINCTKLLKVAFKEEKKSKFSVGKILAVIFKKIAKDSDSIL